MPNYFGLDSAACNTTAWGSGSLQPSTEEEAAADVDEPPDHFARRTSDTQIYHSFQKTIVVPRSREHAQSLLTKALQSQSEDEALDSSAASNCPRRRRSITSNVSTASTTDFTSDTGITTPPRTSSPSPSRLLIDGVAPVQARRKISFACPAADADATPKPPVQKPVTPAPAETQPRKRCISFACADAKPTSKATGPNDKANDQIGATNAKAVIRVTDSAAVPTSGNTTAGASGTKPAEPRRPCIKFACPVRPSTDCHKPHTSTLKVDAPESRRMPRRPSPAPPPEPRSPVSYRKHHRGASSGRSPRPPSRPGMPRQASSRGAVPTRSKKYISAQPEDLAGESSRFHEFASDSIVDDDWIRHAKASMGHKITINDTLKKELAIRLLAKEAEEEAALEDGEDDDDAGNVSGDEEDEEDEEDEDEDEDEEDEDEDDEDEDDDDDFDEEDEEDDEENDTVEDRGRSFEMDLISSYRFDAASDGYNTDNEVGFASSDDEDDGLVLWTVKQNQNRHREEYQDIGHSTLYQGESPVFRRLSVDEQSDSSAYVEGQAIRQDKPKNRELNGRRPATPELPDSTDFVCGTFDEDRPLEEAYLSHMAARKREKYRTIPQDIDPSFPTSDPEDSDNGDKYNKKAHQPKQQHGSAADDHLWLHGELDDLHHGQDQAEGRRKKDRSPRRCRSPPPPKARGRSPVPRHLFERHSPNRRLKSPAPRFAAPQPQALQTTPAMPVSPRASPVEISVVADTIAHQSLAFRPGLTQTKSLPRPPAIFRNQHTLNHHHGSGKPARRPKTNGMTSTKPMHIRGALDIVKGLEQKRQRRKEKFQQKYCNRARKGQAPERRPQRGEGAERMRELGLLMAGKLGQGPYVISI